MKGRKSEKQFTRLLAFLLAYLFLTPFIPQNSWTTVIVQIWLSVTLLFAASVAQNKKKHRTLIVVLVLVAVCLHWLGIYEVLPFSGEGALFLFVVFYALLIHAFGKRLIRARHVTGEVIMVALCIYLVIGLLWGAGYALMDALSGGTAFGGTLLENVQTSKLHLYNYFSMVTLTTLGYGDITPQIPEAASLCQMEAIIGQFFTAVLVAWLVGMYGKPMGRQQPEQE
ncbi:Ion channel protein [Verrucomicrobiaceae bacterium N1E253]|uniref:Ion channel protein n=2 Tax=Oceaniferula marina TaxID=2748318 RepID=A0A851GNX0_9BACT|nr:Ion channel protein [Oceaniferula marina]